jgi:predicted acyl esterase
VDVATSGTTVMIDLKATAYVVASGHKLRLHITSSSFPRLERNPHTAVQHVLHDAEHPSAVLLAIPEVTP